MSNARQIQAIVGWKRCDAFSLFIGRKSVCQSIYFNELLPNFSKTTTRRTIYSMVDSASARVGSLFKAPQNVNQTPSLDWKCYRSISSLDLNHCMIKTQREFCTLLNDGSSKSDSIDGKCGISGGSSANFGDVSGLYKPLDFTKVNKNSLPTVVIIGRPNVGKSALFNRLIRRREALVFNTPEDHVTRDIREGIAKLGDLRFRVLDSAGLEAAATSGSILDRTAGMTANVLERCQFAIFLTDARDGLHPLDQDVGKWLRRHALKMNIIVAVNKAESLFDSSESLVSATTEAYKLGFGDPIAISAETGLGMQDLYAALKPKLEDYMIQNLTVSAEDSVEGVPSQDNNSSAVEESKIPLQLAIVGRPNVGKSTLLNTLLQEERVLVGPEAGLTRDSIRAEFNFQGRTIYLVDTAGWLHRTKQEKGPASLSIVQSRKNLMRAHVVALVLDAEEVAKARRSMTHAEVVIARQAVEEGRGLVVIVNKMDLLRRKQNLHDKVMEAVPEEIQMVIPQVTGIPVVFTSALEGRGRVSVMRQVIDTYEKWCLRLSTARLNRWLRKIMSRHSWKDQAALPKVKYFTQVKSRPPTFVAFVSGKAQLSDTEIRFITKSLKEDFDMGGIPIRIMQRTVERKYAGALSKTVQSARKKPARVLTDKRTVAV